MHVKCWDPADIVIEYIARLPFQMYDKNTDTLFPLSPVTGWTEKLKSYRWPSLSDGLENNNQKYTALRLQLQELDIENLHQAQYAKKLHDIFFQICFWNQLIMPENNPGILAREVREVVIRLQENEIPVGYRINVAWNRLYAHLLPDKFAMYDSRISAALLTILDPFMNVLCRIPIWENYSFLGTIPGRGGSRPRKFSHKWKSGYGNWKTQISANKLLLDIQSRLNSEEERMNPLSGNNRIWTLREIEAVLFMHGY
jgi:hypothetical protein